ncbi:hypothetical protein GGS23DRAFT_561706 [Durotheca rogersii]|uniref:uncharacterized protein n=1 Tax=Durotheca rogersii TaxID=419775 RepID=UPI00221FA211|nr:uncharacterized protein GGS23DRAFT_561706 [Durotheca rogersii]KAI5864769.1 hypothetical protein GGS23DRAFT_561706 [Durotheca rogersii]
MTKSLEANPKVKEWVKAQECGTTQAFQPAISLTTLEGWGPAVPASHSTFAQANTALRQARILGGGRPFDADGGPSTAADFQNLYINMTGVFVPPASANAQYLARHVVRNRKDKEPVPGRMHVPPEVGTAILEDAMLGRYDGPKFAQPGDVYGTIDNYVKRDGTWNAAAGRALHSKVLSLLGGGAVAAGPPPPPPA